MHTYHKGHTLNGRIFTSDQIARFWAKVAKTDGCWLWSGALDSKGYGRMRVPGSKPMAWTGAHRFSYYLAHGSIPDERVIDHDPCNTPACVNPSHLVAVTQAQNLLRSDTTIPGRNMKRTHFQCGCEITIENTLNEGTTRRCRKHRTEYMAAYRRNKVITRK